MFILQMGKPRPGSPEVLEPCWAIPPSSWGRPGVTGASVGTHPPTGLTLSSWEGEAVLPAAVGERALTQHADHLGVLQHGGPTGGLHRHPHVPRVHKPRRHRVLQGQAGLWAQVGVRNGPESWPHGSSAESAGGAWAGTPHSRDAWTQELRSSDTSLPGPPVLQRRRDALCRRPRVAARLGVPVTFLPHPKLSWAVAPSRLDPRARLSTHPMGWGTHIDHGVRTMASGPADGETEAPGGTATLQELS